MASGMSRGSDKSVMFGFEMADLCEPSLEDLMALHTKCGRWLKHTELEIEERRQKQQDIMDQQEAEREAEAAGRGRLGAESVPRYDPSMPTDDGDWNADPAVHPTPDAIPKPKTEDDPNIQEDNPDLHEPPLDPEDDPNVQQPPLHMEDDLPQQPPPNTEREVVRMCPNCRIDAGNI